MSRQFSKEPNFYWSGERNWHQAFVFFHDIGRDGGLIDIDKGGPNSLY
jgi:hypothetical protein